MICFKITFRVSINASNDDIFLLNPWNFKKTSFNAIKIKFKILPSDRKIANQIILLLRGISWLCKNNNNNNDFI